MSSIDKVNVGGTIYDIKDSNVIDDTATSTDTTWSSSKINTENTNLSNLIFPTLEVAGVSFSDFLINACIAIINSNLPNYKNLNLSILWTSQTIVHINCQKTDTSVNLGLLRVDYSPIATGTYEFAYNNLTQTLTTFNKLTTTPV